MSRVSNLIKAARTNVGQKFVQPPLFIPMGCVTPETPKNETFRLLYEAGIISKADYEKSLGGTYDIDLRNNDKEDLDETLFSSFEEFEDEFKLSELSQYYEDDYDTDTPQAQEPTGNSNRTQDISGSDGSEAAGNNGEAAVEVTDEQKS